MRDHHKNLLLQSVVLQSATRLTINNEKIIKIIRIYKPKTRKMSRNLAARTAHINGHIIRLHRIHDYCDPWSLSEGVCQWVYCDPWSLSKGVCQCVYCDPWSLSEGVCQRVCHSSDYCYPFSRWRHFDAVIAALQQITLLLVFSLILQTIIFAQMFAKEEKSSLIV